MSGVYIGTSGWVYKSWQKEFYPEDVPVKRQFQFYATQFPTVEINATFYRLPTPGMVKGWREKAPPGFVFALKGSRFITHIKRLEAPAQSLRRFFSRISPLRERLGPVLWQLPPSLKMDLGRLEKFLKRLPQGLCHAIEFRHPSWYAGSRAFELLRQYNAAHVSLSSQRMPTNLTVTADFVYARFHGLQGGAAHDYTRNELEPWAKFMRQQARAGRTVYGYFNNDVNVRAPENARLLMRLVGKDALRPPAAESTR